MVATNFYRKDKKVVELENSYRPLDICNLRVLTQNCCGIYLVENFGDYVFTNNKEAFRIINEEVTYSAVFYDSHTKDVPANFTLMAFLITSQLEDGWQKELDKYGWVEVTRFFNPNTKNTCHQFIKHIEESKDV